MQNSYCDHVPGIFNTREFLVCEISCEDILAFNEMPSYPHSVVMPYYGWDVVKNLWTDVGALKRYGKHNSDTIGKHLLDLCTYLEWIIVIKLIYKCFLSIVWTLLSWCAKFLPCGDYHRMFHTVLFCQSLWCCYISSVSMYVMLFDGIQFCISVVSI